MFYNEDDELLLFFICLVKKKCFLHSWIQKKKLFNLIIAFNDFEYLSASIGVRIHE